MRHKNDPPRVAAIHDLSCFGRCALSVVTPILSVMGAQVIPIPTALLSSHTGGFDNLYFRDLTDDMRGIIAHFERIGVSFDAIYSGFLGSEGQIDIVAGFIDAFGEGIPVLVDPVMGDNGSLYGTYTRGMAERMESLCRRATVITPNLTEACLLAGLPMPDGTPSGAAASSLAGELAGRLRSLFGEKEIVITGIYFDADGQAMIANAHAAPGGEFRLISHPRLSRSFPGTGEVFASALLGGIIRGEGFDGAIEKAAAFTRLVIEGAQDSDSPSREGVPLEKFLAELCREA